MVSTQMKKEAADVRKMIAASRLAKKQAAAKERKHKKAGAPATKPSQELTEKQKLKLRMRKGVMITKEDLMSSKTTTAAADTPSKKGADKKKKGATTQPVAPAAIAASATVEPPFNYEIHHKKAVVTFRVTLHKVPPSTIDISQTTSKTFVVQTPKFTKKFFLSFPLPGGLEVVPADADYTFDMGILTCVLPIKDGKIPAELKEERTSFLQKCTTQKAMRFRVGKDGELVVRTRQALLPAELKTNKKQDAKNAASAKPTAEDAKKAGDSKKKDAKKAPVENAKPAKPSDVAASKKVLEAAKKAAVTVAGTMTLTPEGKQAALAAKPQVKKVAAAPQVQGAPRKQFVEDGAAMLAIADAAGKVVKNKLYESINKAKVMQAKKMTRVSGRQDKSEVKKEKQEISFARVLAEQKRMLMTKLEHQKPAAPKANPSNKQVKFA